MLNTKTVDCVWAQWEVASRCSKLCGGGDKTGTKRFRRAKKIEEKHNGKCYGNSWKLRRCTTNTNCPGKTSYPLVKLYYLSIFNKLKVKFQLTYV